MKCVIVITFMSAVLPSDIPELRKSELPQRLVGDPYLFTKFHCDPICLFELFDGLV